MRAPTTKDDRGQVVPLFTGEGGARSRADRVLWASLDHSRSRTLGSGEVMWYLGVLAMIIGAFTVNYNLLRKPLPGYVFWPIVFVTSVVFGLLAMRSMKQHQSGRIRFALLNAGLCASCGYSLDGSRRATPEKAGADMGLVVCPECGAAWRRT